MPSPSRTRSSASPQPELDLITALREFAMEGWLLQKQLGQPYHLSLVQFMLLRSIDAEGVSHPSELAAAFGVSPPAMTLLIGGLEAKGWLRRSPSTVDRRAVEVVLTPRARRVLRAIEARRRQVTDAVVSPIPRGRRFMLAETLRLMSDRLRSERTRPSAGHPRDSGAE